MQRQECPSTGAYRRHLRDGEDPKALDCGCLEAHNAHQRELYARRNPSRGRQLEPCPSPAAYIRHRRAGEDVTQLTCGCREAYNALQAERYAKRKALAG